MPLILGTRINVKMINLSFLFSDIYHICILSDIRPWVFDRVPNFILCIEVEEVLGHAPSSFWIISARTIASPMHTKQTITNFIQSGLSFMVTQIYR